MQIDFTGKTILITGAAHGLGLATARMASALGASVAMADIRVEGNGSDANLPSRARTYQADVANPEACLDVVERVRADFGRIDCLVNSAGIIEPSVRTIDQNPEMWRRVIDVNLQGTYLMCRAAAQAMSSQISNDNQERGAIVNIASITGLGGFRASNAYGVSKAAVSMLTKTLALDLAHLGIRVNAVAPGFIDTDMTTNLREGRGGAEQYLRRTPLGRFGRPEEVARSILFLASDWASFTTGTVLRVDGGWMAFAGAGDAARI